MSEEKTVLLSIKLDTGDLKKNADIASAKIEELKIKQAILRSENKQGTVEYAKLNSEIKAQTLVLNQSAKSIEINERLGNKQNLSLKEQAELLSAGKVALRNYTKEEIANSEAGRQLNKEVNDLNESLKESEKAYGDNQREVGNYEKAIDGLPAPFDKAKNGLKGLSDGFKLLLANPVVLVISAIVGVLYTLYKAFTSTEEGSNTLNKGMTFLSGVVSSFFKIIQPLAKFLVDNVVKAFQTVSKVADTFSSAIVKTLDTLGFKSAANGIKDLTDKSKALKKTTDDIANSEAELIKLRREQRKIQLQYQADAEKLRQLRDDESKSMPERFKANEKLGILLAKQSKAELTIAEKELALVNKKIGLEGKSTELLDAKAEAELQIIDINERIIGQQSEQLVNINSLNRESKQLETERTENAIESSKKRTEASAKATEKELEFLYKLADLQLENEDKLNENLYKKAEIKYNGLMNISTNSVEKLIQIQKDYNLELDALDKEAQADALAKADDSKKREITDAKGNQQLLTEIEKKYVLEKVAINIEYENKKKVIDAQSIKDTELFNKTKLEDERKTKNEIKLIDAELNYQKAKGTADEKAMFEAFQKTKIQVLEDNAKKELLIENQTVEQKDLIRSKLALDTEKINNEEFKKSDEKTVKETEKKLKDEQEKQQKITTVTLNSAMQLTDAISQMQQAKIQNELEEEKNKNDEKNKFLKEQLDANLITEAEYNTQKSAIDAEYKATESKLKTEAFKKEKQANIIKATMSTALGVVGALPNVPLSILAGVLGAVQTGLIASQPVPKFAKGGIFGGNSHSNGGTKGVFSDGTQIEVERDENFYILNKNASRHINGLSNLNQQFGGIPLMGNGGAVTSSGIMATSITNGVDANLNAQNQMMRMIEMMPKPVVVVQDITDAQGNLATVENRANF